MNSNTEMVESLKSKGYIETEKVEKAFKNVDRVLFVPERHRNEAYSDTPLPISEEVTISAPHMVAINTELLDIKENSRVLEIGSGSGYQLAVIAEIADKAVGVEIIEELVDQSRENLEDWPNTEVIHGEGLKAVERGFDRILFSCSVEPKRVDEAREKLADDGIVLAPVKTSRGQFLKKFENGDVEDHGRVRFVSYRDSLQ